MKKNNNNLTTSYGISSVPVDLSVDVQDALIMLHDFKYQRVSIHNQQKCSIISSADATNELMSISNLQEQKGIVSEYVFCHEDGEWIKTDAYETCLRRMCQSLGFTVTNNHALRMALNSNVFIPLGIPVTERARMLGHSVETNLRKYSFAGKNSNGNILEVLNGYHTGTTQINVS